MTPTEPPDAGARGGVLVGGALVVAFGGSVSRHRALAPCPVADEPPPPPELHPARVTTAAVATTPQENVTLRMGPHRLSRSRVVPERVPSATRRTSAPRLRWSRPRGRRTRRMPGDRGAAPSPGCGGAVGEHRPPRARRGFRPPPRGGTGRRGAGRRARPPGRWPRSRDSAAAASRSRARTCAPSVPRAWGPRGEVTGSRPPHGAGAPGRVASGNGLAGPGRWDGGSGPARRERLVGRRT